MLSPYNNKGNLSAYALNMAIRDRVNPLERGKIVLKRDKDSFRDNDRVIILQNDRERNCSNGDVGILHILKVEEKRVTYCVKLPDGRCPTWDDASGLAQLSLAYCLTVHKSQGSEYDTILLPVAKGMDGMLSRNLLYTAISRAKKRVILYGDPQPWMWLCKRISPSASPCWFPRPVCFWNARDYECSS